MRYLRGDGNQAGGAGQGFADEGRLGRLLPRASELGLKHNRPQLTFHDITMASDMSTPAVLMLKPCSSNSITFHKGHCHKA